MRAADLARLYDYGCWANRKLLGAGARLTPDELTRPVAGSYGSVRDTLVHAVVHAVHHRGQVALLLRELGHAPGNVDLLLHAIERRSAPADG